MNIVTKRRPSRADLIRSSGVVLHAYNRGVDRQQMFFDNSCYAFFLALVKEFLVQSDLLVLSYCLMPNHFHLLIQQLKPYAISSLMEAVCGEYARTVNAWRGRTGRLYEKPYGVKWVWRDSDIPLLANYIHENPTAAHLVSSPEEWEFSSCREYLGLRENVFLNMQPVLSQLEAGEDYRTFLDLRAKGLANLSKRCLFRE